MVLGRAAVAGERWRAGGPLPAASVRTEAAAAREASRLKRRPCAMDACRRRRAGAAGAHAGREGAVGGAREVSSGLARRGRGMRGDARVGDATGCRGPDGESRPVAALGGRDGEARRAPRAALRLGGESEGEGLAAVWAYRVLDRIVCSGAWLCGNGPDWRARFQACRPKPCVCVARARAGGGVRETEQTCPQVQPFLKAQHLTVLEFNEASVCVWCKVCLFLIFDM